jgi:hypothetical protein
MFTEWMKDPELRAEFWKEHSKDIEELISEAYAKGMAEQVRHLRESCSGTWSTEFIAKELEDHAKKVLSNRPQKEDPS